MRAVHCAGCAWRGVADMVVEVARLLRPVRLRVSGCRLVSARGWEAAVHSAREVRSVNVNDVSFLVEGNLVLYVLCYTTHRVLWNLG
jgi:hypothetical protein